MLIQALLIALVFAPVQENDYIGAQACGACHPAQLSEQSSSGHAASLRPATSHPLTKSFAPPGPLKRASNFQFTFELNANQFKVRISDGKNGAEMPIEWAFGSGNHAVTFVSQVDEDSYVEHYFTYYAAARTLDATPGHQSLKAGSLKAAFGLLYRTFDPDPAILRCFRCHSTGRLTLGEKLEVRPGELGVRCEACHGPGRLHAAAAGRNEAEGGDGRSGTPGGSPAGNSISCAEHVTASPRRLGPPPTGTIPGTHATSRFISSRARASGRAGMRSRASVAMSPTGRCGKKSLPITTNAAPPATRAPHIRQSRPLRRSPTASGATCRA